MDAFLPNHRSNPKKLQATCRTSGWLALPLLSIVTILAGCSISSRFHQELDVTGFIAAARAAPEGSITTELDGVPYEVDLDKFGAADSSLTLSARVEIDHGPLRFLFDRVGISNKGGGTFEGALGGATLPLDAYALETDLISSRLMMAFPLPGPEAIDALPLDLRLLAGLNLTELRLQLRSLTNPDNFSEIDELVPTPILGLAANLPISPAWNLNAILTFFPLSEVTDYETECIDGQIRIGWTPTQDWELFLGARNHSLKVVGEQAGRPTEIDLQLELLEIGISYSF